MRQQRTRRWSHGPTGQGAPVRGYSYTPSVGWRFFLRCQGPPRPLLTVRLITDVFICSHVWKVAASGRQYTSQTTCRWHPIATGVVRHIEVLKTAGGSESVSTLSRPEWPSWPFSPSAWMQESSELLPATGPRAARGRADAAEAAGCTVVATAKLAPLSLKIYPPPPPHFLSNNMFLS